MQKAVRWIVMLIIFSALMLMTSCQYNVGIKTELVLNEDGSGYRRMYYEYPFEKRKQLSAAKICDVVESGIDSELMSFERPDMDKARQQGYYLFEIFINFNSLEEYESKVQKILNKGGVNLKAESYFFDQAGLFEKAVGYKENFTTEQLLAWLEAAGDNHIKNYVEEKFQFMHFYPENVSTMVRIGDKLYPDSNTVNGAININYDNLVRISNVDISVAVLSEDTMSRKMSIAFSGDYSQDEQRITNYYDSLLKDERDVQYQYENGTLTVEFSGDFERIALLTENILGASCVIQSSEDMSKEDMFVKNISYTESIDMGMQDVEINYEIINGDSGMADGLKVTDINGGDLLTELDGGAWKAESSLGGIRAEFTLSMREYIASVEYSLKHLSGDSYERVIKFMPEDDSQETANSLKTQFDNIVSGKLTTVEGNSVVLKVTGTINEINGIQQRLLGNDNYISVEHSSDFYKLYNDLMITDNINLGSNFYTISKTSDIIYRFVPSDSDIAPDSVMQDTSVENGQAQGIAIKTLNSFAVYIYLSSFVVIVLFAVTGILFAIRMRAKKRLKNSVPMGGYITSDGIIIMPSDMAVPDQRERTEIKDYSLK